MRNDFARAAVEMAQKPNCFFLTGDLGFMALEEVRDAFGERFINCGISEQNMVSVAAGLAREGNQCFVYSIAPFCYARPFEQIRNDVGFAGLSVCLIGNGGGYGYGVMGPSHHALEDCAAMSALGLRVLVPCFNEDLAPMMQSLTGPTYLRLGYDVRPKSSSPPQWQPWNCVSKGIPGKALVALGPLAGAAWEALLSFPEAERPSLWACSELSCHKSLPKEFLQDMRDGELFVLEEHVQHGGLGMELTYAFAQANIHLSRFEHRFALGYPSGTYGTQNFHRMECGLDVSSILSMLQRGQHD